MNLQFAKSAKTPTIPPNRDRSAEIIESIRRDARMAQAAYQAKRDARADRYEAMASKARSESTASYAAQKRILDFIPMGQPILIGHHSEKRHRADLNRADNLMRKSCEASSKAKHYDNKAESARDNDAIFSDDPEALRKLREKLADLESMQEMMKAVNAAHKKYLKNPASLEASPLPDKYKEKIRSYVPRYSWEPHPFPPYSLQNNNANITRVRERIKQLSHQRSEGPKADRIVCNGTVQIVDNAEANRVQIYFPGKPSEEVRKQLKSFGFRWSPSEGAWQAYRNNSTEYRLTVLFPELKEVKEDTTNA